MGTASRAIVREDSKALNRHAEGVLNLVYFPDLKIICDRTTLATTGAIAKAVLALYDARLQARSRGIAIVLVFQRYSRPSQAMAQFVEALKGAQVIKVLQNSSRTSSKYGPNHFCN